MNAIELLGEQIQQAHQLLEATMEGVTNEEAKWLPPGTANPLGATYVHAVASEDAVIHMILQGQAPLYASSWANRTGVSDIQPLSSPEWARSVKVDIPILREYAQAVHHATDDYIETLMVEELARLVDMSNLGLGELSVGHILSRFVLGHIDNMCGEISCLKGLQGGKGYPF
ncbi:MAG: DinB family protein [Chloroflexi bacterium]|nr:DinB family protein [Chloroflexota bacterium]